MDLHMSISSGGKLKMTMGSDKVRKDDMDKFLKRNRDAILVKLEGPHDGSMKYNPGHVCRIEEDNENEKEYNVFVGKHYIGRLPVEAIRFADMVNSDPEFLVAVVGKVEHNENTKSDDIFIYIAE